MSIFRKELGFCLLGYLLSVAAVSCSTTGSQRATAPGSSAGERAREYAALREKITQYHEKSLIAPEETWLFSGDEDDAYFRSFAESYCDKDEKTGKPVPHLICERRFVGLVNSIFSRKYFAADHEQIHETCASEPLVCGDLQASEFLFRKLHNAGIEKSKREKLALLDDWNRSKLSDSELAAALGFQFKFEGGQLLIRVPQESKPEKSMTSEVDLDGKPGA